MDIRMLHYITKGCLPMNTSIFVPSSSEGLTSAVCPDVYSYFSVYLGHYLGYPPREPCAVPVGPAGAQLHLAHSLWTPEMWGQSHNLTLYKNFTQQWRNKTHRCWPEHGACWIYTCVVWELGKNEKSRVLLSLKGRIVRLRANKYLRPLLWHWAVCWQ